MRTQAPAPAPAAVPPSGYQIACRRLRDSVLAVAPPPKITVSQWADANREIAKGTGPFPGRWLTDRAPYQRGMMDAFTEPGVEEIVLMTASQVGKTEVIMNGLGYFVDVDPSAILSVLPTVELAEAWSKERLQPTIESTPALSRKVRDAKSRDSDNTITRKRFVGGSISVVGANAPAGLAMRPIRVVLCDEIDRFPASAGVEGDPISLAKRRTSNYWNRKLIYTSTPTVEGLSRVFESWTESDQRRFYVPCPSCGERQILKWEPGVPSLGYEGAGGLVFEKDERGVPISSTARYKCGACGVLIDEFEKRGMLAAGEWRATFPDRRMRGFHLSSLYSPWVRWSELVDEWTAAHKNPERLKVFVNTLLGEPWKEEAEAIDTDALRARLEGYPVFTEKGDLAWSVPAGVGVLVAAVDVQSARLEVAVKGYGAGEESWLIEHAVIAGDPGTLAPWDDLRRYLGQSWKHENGAELRLSLAVVDSGGHHTDHVYRFCHLARPRGGVRVFPIKGAGGPRDLVGRPGKTERLRVPLYIVGVDVGKDVVWSRLKVREPGPGYLHLPRTVDDEYLEQLVAERPVRVWKRQSGWTRVWKKVRDRNEAWDLEVYSLAALYILGPAVVRSLASRAAALVPAGAPVDGELPPEPAPAPRRRPRRKGYVQGWR